jgi:outer membrane biosynthesis protein TonB
MKAQLLMLSAAGLLFAASASHAAPSELQQYLDRAHAQADRTLAAASVPLPGPVTVKAYVGGDGRLNNVHVIRTSGSRDADFAVEQALKRLAVADAPAPLVGATIKLTLGDAPIVQAKAP